MAIGFVQDREPSEGQETSEVRHGESIKEPPKPVVTFTADQVIALLEAALKPVPEPET